MKVETQSNLFTTIYRYLNDGMFSSHHDFVKAMFQEAGSNYFVGESDELARKIFSGDRVISDGLYESVPKRFKHYKIITLLEKSLNKSRFNEMLQAFDIKPSIQDDFHLFCKSLAYQFANLVIYRDECNTTVAGLYQIELNEKANKAHKDANEHALLKASEAFSNSLSSILSVKRTNSLLKDKEAIENTLLNIGLVFRSFESNCNSDGRTLYDELRNKIILKSKDVGKYFKMVSEPGTLPITLIKKVEITTYPSIEKKNSVVRSYQYDNDYTRKDLIEILEKSVPYTQDLVLFSERMIYHLPSDTSNIVLDLSNIVIKINQLLRKLGERLKSNNQLRFLNDKNTKDLRQVKGIAKLQLLVDGTYYKNTKQFSYDERIEMILEDKDGMDMFTGDTKIDFKKIVWVYNTNFDKTFNNYCDYVTTMVKTAHRSMNQMTEWILIYPDGLCRYYMMPPTSKAGLIRRTQDILQIAKQEDPIAFLFEASFAQSNDDYVGVFGFYKDENYAFSLSRTEIITGKNEGIPKMTTGPDFLMNFKNVISKNSNIDCSEVFDNII